jgi:ABC-type phosphate transport system auxiliary subunit
MKEVQSYCDNVVTELSVWKAKIYDVVRKIDKVSSGDKAKLGNQVNDLHMVIEEIENRISKLRTECPMDWKPEQVELETRFTQLKTKMNDVSKSLSPGELGG